VSAISRKLPDPGSYTEAPCGCEFWTQDGVFVIRSCAPDCEVYAYAVAETRRQGHPLEFRRE